jgi:NAD(P)-dependent dehydrogenase (short-subunit alcohol dehydrogenase family)
MTQIPESERKTLVLTGASRGIGHATVKRFSSAGWRVITCSRHPFPENCPWEAGSEDHIQVDLADTADTERAIGEMRERLKASRAAGCGRWSTMPPFRPSCPTASA